MSALLILSLKHHLEALFNSNCLFKVMKIEVTIHSYFSVQSINNDRHNKNNEVFHKKLEKNLSFAPTTKFTSDFCCDTVCHYL